MGLKTPFQSIQLDFFMSKVMKTRFMIPFLFFAKRRLKLLSCVFNVSPFCIPAFFEKKEKNPHPYERLKTVLPDVFKIKLF